MEQRVDAIMAVTDDQLRKQHSHSVPDSLILWLALVFASFGLFAPDNGTAVTILVLCSLAVSWGITMILDLDTNFSGLVRVSAEPLRQALAQLMH